MLSEIRRVYRHSLKPSDSLFNLWFARPIAAAVVVPLARTRVTPNQVSFASLGLMLLSAAAFMGVGGLWGLWLGVLLVEASYVLDCADGQLARLTQRSSAVGAQLDFLMDELKALLLIGALSVRGALHDGGGARSLTLGVVSLVVVGVALSLTKFIRSPEWAQATGERVLQHGEASGATRSQGGKLWPLLALIRAVSQYPTTLPLFALVGRLEPFVWAYGAVHLLYVGATGLKLLRALGQCAPAPPVQKPEEPEGI